jgi:hypothetical protein
MCTPIEAGDTGVIRAAGVAFVKLITSPDELGVVLHERLAEFVGEIVFVFRTIDQSGWRRLPVHYGIEYGDAGGVAMKWRNCLRTSARHYGQKRENQSGLAHDDGSLVVLAAKIHFFGREAEELSHAMA